MNNGEKPAYPDPMRGADQSYGNQCPESLSAGLTKREQFAAMMMQGLLTGLYSNPEMAGWDSASIAKEAVSNADSLLKALETNKEQ